MNEQIETIIRNYIEQVVHLSLSTAVDNKPWTCEVHYSYDDELNLYFISRPSRRHSLEIAENPNVSGTIAKQHNAGEPVQGVYFEGTCEVVPSVTVNDAPFTTYHERFGVDASKLDEQQEENGHLWYKVAVKDWYLFDEIEMEQPGKYHLEWKH